MITDNNTTLLLLFRNYQQRVLRGSPANSPSVNDRIRCIQEENVFVQRVQWATIPTTGVSKTINLSENCRWRLSLNFSRDNYQFFFYIATFGHDFATLVNTLRANPISNLRPRSPTLFMACHSHLRPSAAD